jgi:hypothetical protein
LKGGGIGMGAKNPSSVKNSKEKKEKKVVGKAVSSGRMMGKTLDEKKRELKRRYKLVGIREAVNFLKKELKLRFGEKSIENQIVRKKIGKLVSVGKRKIRVFSSDDVEKLKKLYMQYNPLALKSKYKAIGIFELKNILKKYGINKTKKSIEGLLSRLAKKSKIKKVYDKFKGRRVLVFNQETIQKIVSYLKQKSSKK